MVENLLMLFTSLHHYLGRQPGPMTEDMVDDAIEAGLEETDDLDWKQELIPSRALATSDFPKDVAAMANRGGGMLVYGVKEENKAAVKRCDAGQADENYQRTMMQTAVNRISPPIFGLNIIPLNITAPRAVAVIIPPTLDGPHLIYRGEYFGAPIRNGPDTEWMKEREIEAAYRFRFDQRRHAGTTLDALYEELTYGKADEGPAWVLAAAYPRIPVLTPAPSQDDARAIFQKSAKQGLFFAGRGTVHPVESIDMLNPRVGLRRWTARTTATSESTAWKRAEASLHHDGAVTLTAVLGGEPSASDRRLDLAPERIDSGRFEATIADFMGLLRETGEARGISEYAVKVGVEWASHEPLIIKTKDWGNFDFDGSSIPLHRYTPVATSIIADAAPLDFYWQVHDLAVDCVNQGGIADLRMIRPPDQEE